jgi:protein-disulfide isomerase
MTEIRYPRPRAGSGKSPARASRFSPAVLAGAAVAAAALVAGALILVSVLGSGTSDVAASPAPAHLTGAAATQALLEGVPQDGISLGDPEAPVTLVEFADVQCPYCADWARNAFPVLVRNYVRPGKLRIELHGLAFLGPESDVALRATLAAGEQGRLWNLLELLYLNQGAENGGWVTESFLRRLGASVPALDVDAMLAGRSSAAVERLLVEARASAQLNGIAGTPSFLLGETGGALQRVELTSLGPDGITPAIDALLR